MKLSYEQTKELIKRGILGNNGSMITIEGLSVNNIDEYRILGYKGYINDIIFYVERVRDLSTHKISYKRIDLIAGMDVQRVLESYDIIGSSRVEEIDVETDVENELIGKEKSVIDGIEIEEGMRFKFYNDINKKYNERIFTIKRDENNYLKLVAGRGRPKKNMEKI